MQCAEMLGDDILKNSPDTKQKTDTDDMSVHTSSAQAEKKIEEEIQEEIKLAEKKLKTRERNINEDLVEDFENYSDDGFDENADKQ